MLKEVEIKEIILELNEVFKENNEFFFVYETNYWYECIRFNEHVLWDSEDSNGWLSENPDWVGYDNAEIEDDIDDDIIGCVKRRYNDYINKLKGYRFDDVKSKRYNRLSSHDMVDAIFTELDGRKGIDILDFDSEIQDEIHQACVNIVEKHN